ncbi:cysteine hydrolase family protein [Amycolatopsis taiwanensis]|uniref:cysteine hydrolase family protein n=1 Tax=Amycolatopsis taiwanensis TaxID=342230 RepID=UPI0004BC3486|nr:cysteine hydrolase [Amycolatopsis taiwanensis]
MVHETALVVVDMQNSFCHPEGVVGRDFPVHECDSVVHETQQALARARELGVPIVYVYTTYRPDYLDASPTWRKVNAAVAANKAMVEGSWDAEIVAEIAPRPGDHLVVKRGFDGFLHTYLEPTLRYLGARKLLLLGVYTNVCVETTARTAFQLDFEVTVLSDCTGDTSAEEREMSFRAVGRMFATVAPWRDALAELAPTPA